MWHCPPSSSRAISNHLMRQLLSLETLLASFSALRSKGGSGERLLPEGNDRAPDWGHREGGRGGTELLPSRFHSWPHPKPDTPAETRPGVLRSGSCTSRASAPRGLTVPFPIPLDPGSGPGSSPGPAKSGAQKCGGAALGGIRQRRGRGAEPLPPPPPYKSASAPAPPGLRWRRRLRSRCGGSRQRPARGGAGRSVPSVQASRRFASAPSHRITRCRRVPVPRVPDPRSSRPVPSRSSPGWRVPASLVAASSLPSLSRPPRLPGPGLSVPLVAARASSFVLLLPVPGPLR